MKTKILLLPFFLLQLLNCFAQSTFERLIQTDQQSYGVANAITKTADGGFVVVGGITTDAYVAKFDVNGNDEWKKKFGSPNGSMLVACIQTQDKGYALIGNLYSVGSCAIKLDSAGNQLWYKSLNGEYTPSVVSIAETADSSLVICGTTSYLSVFNNKYEGAYCALKLSRNGELVWNYVFKKELENINDRCLNMFKTDKDEFILCGYGTEHDYNSSALIKFNTDGNVLWSKGFDGGNFYTRDFIAITQDKDSLVAFGWGTNSYDEFEGFQILKLNSITGEIISGKKINSTTNRMGPSKACIRTKDGAYVVVANVNNLINGLEFGPIIKYNKNFGVVWAKQFYECCDFVPAIHSIAELNDGSLVVAGSLNNKMYVAKLTSSGGFCRQLKKYDDVDLTDYIDEAGNYPLNIEGSMDVLDISYSLQESGIVITNCSTILPLMLLSFSASNNGVSNILKWSTTQEFNTSNFEIQRSNNGTIFSTLSVIRSAGNSEEINNYAYTDALPLKATNYYRLKIIDKDGKFTYSNVVNVKSSNTFNVSIYQNPVHQNIILNVNAEKSTALQINIVNAGGKIVYTDKVQVPVGATLKEINVASLSNGNYFLNCIGSGEHVKLKFVKQ